VQNSKTEPRYTANPIPITPKSFKEVKSIGLRDLRALCKDAWTVLEIGKTVFNLGSCWLHILQDDFRDGCNAAKWNIEDSLSNN
jgi:hypothetical protein